MVVTGAEHLNKLQEGQTLSVVSQVGAEAVKALTGLQKTLIAGALATGVGTGAMAQENNSFVAGAEYQVANASDTISDAQYDNMEATITNNAGEIIVFQGVETQKMIQLQFVLEAVKQNSSIELSWLDLSADDMRSVIAIHAGELPLDGESQAHEFYRELILEFMSFGKNEYVEASFAADEYYSRDEYAVYWDEFAENFVAGIVSDLDYTAEFAPNFSQTVITLLPDHPLADLLRVEIDTVLKTTYVEERQAYVEERQAYVEERQAYVLRTQQAADALERLNATLTGS